MMRYKTIYVRDEPTEQDVLQQVIGRMLGKPVKRWVGYYTDPECKKSLRQQRTNLTHEDGDIIDLFGRSYVVQTVPERLPVTLSRPNSERHVRCP